ncbi:MAG TPA: ATP-binding cassette domain-containing protein, partial [Candidatus Babeliales bacterium]|nr:ATP-binding cassette domain-containing protein [Candidatus Babeliales bacterium]
DKVERIEIPPGAKNVQFSFPPVPPTGKQVLSVEQVSQKFGTKTVFQNVTFAVERGQKVAIIAPNGVGKTTLFNLITGALPRQHGTITFGHNVKHAIFAQDQNQALNLRQSVIDNLRDLCANVPEPRIRSFLGAFLFSGEQVEKKVSVLSGGEKNRVGMINVLLQNANLLLLDEPTNHLDIPSKAILLKALQEFGGTILFVSHDRDFINDLATDIIELTPNGAHYHHGNYSDYLYYQQQLAKNSHDANSENITQNTTKHTHSNTTSSRSPRAKSSGIEGLERQIQKLEQQIKALNSTFGDLDYGTPEFATAVEKLEKLQAELASAEQAWEKLS